VWGCIEFETRRNDWSQMPAAVQVSAAERVVFDQDIFAHLGQIALGIGNNADAHATGVGLGARSIEVRRSVFTDLAGGAILAGGISRDAHHPPEPAMANRDVLIIDNRISTVSQVYMDNSAILSTYVAGALILHNDISDAPYDGIDIGWGWGVNDAGGNPVYRDARRGYYDHPENLVYETPTLHRGVVVAYNDIHHIKRLFHDGGAIYNLSASRDTVIEGNYIHDIPDRIALYLDEGSRYLTLRDNVVEGAGTWLNINTLDDYWPLRITTDYVDRLEEACDAFGDPLPALRSFVLPGGTPAAAHLHVARTIVRRAERTAWTAVERFGTEAPGGVNPLAITYLNRLSDLLFILSRAANATDPTVDRDILWVPGGKRTDEPASPPSGEM
jgi:hypothetical protein